MGNFNCTNDNGDVQRSSIQGTNNIIGMKGASSENVQERNSIELMASNIRLSMRESIMSGIMKG